MTSDNRLTQTGPPALPPPTVVGLVVWGIASAVTAVVVGTVQSVGPLYATGLGLATSAGGALLAAWVLGRGRQPAAPAVQDLRDNPRDVA